MGGEQIYGKTFRKDLDLLSDRKFKDVFRELLKEKFSNSFGQLHKATGIPRGTSQKWLAGITVPNANNLEKLLTAEMTDNDRIEVTSSVLTEILAKSKDNIKTNRRKKPNLVLNDYTEIANFPKKTRDLWNKKFKNISKNDIIIKNERRLNFQFKSYVEKYPDGNFSGFIVYLRDKLQATYETLKVSLGLDKSTFLRFNKAHKQNEDRCPSAEVVDSILEHTNLANDPKFSQTFYQFSRGAGLKADLRDIQKDFALKIDAAKSEGEIRKLSKALYIECVAFYGYTTHQVSKLSGISESRADRYGNPRSKEFLIMKSTEEVKDAYRMGQAFSQNDKKLANDLAANFLGFPAYKDKEQIKAEFIKGIIDLRQATVETKCFIARSNGPDFANSIGLQSSHALNLFLNGESKGIGYEFLFSMVKKHLDVKSPEEIKEIKLAVIRDRASNGLQSSGRYVELTFDENGEKRPDAYSRIK